MRRLLVIVLSLLVSLSAYARFNAYETLVIEGEEYRIYNLPMWQLDRSITKQIDAYLHTDLYLNSYGATWVLDGGQIFLDSIDGFDVGPIKDVYLKQYREEDGRLPAKWFSGTLVCGKGDVLIWTEQVENVVLTVENGKVTSSESYVNYFINPEEKEDFFKLNARDFRSIFPYSDFPEVHGYLRFGFTPESYEINPQTGLPEITRFHIEVLEPARPKYNVPYVNPGTLKPELEQRLFSTLNEILCSKKHPLYKIRGQIYWGPYERQTQNIQFEFP